jgi:hypothetical protein
MTDPQTQRNPVEEMAEEFLERYRRGERPALPEYTQGHPAMGMPRTNDPTPAALCGR